MDRYEPGTYGRSFADVYDDWYAHVSDVAGTTATIAALARNAAATDGPGGGRVLELGIGTGRLALPLAAAGVDVTGIDASAEMLAQLATKPGAAAVHAVLGDMADLGTLGPDDGGPFSVVFVAFNTFFNLTEPGAQARALAGVAAVLEPGGRFVLEAFVPPEPGAAPDADVAPRTIGLDHVVLTVSRRDHATSTIAGQHVEISEAGIRMRPWLIRYASTAELDALATASGLTLEARHADWHGTPFDLDSANHVSVYRLAP
jgi:SAM-dependent methyltransferase